MINVKLIVLLFCINVVVVSYSIDYCQVCADHTLCKYTIPGPCPQCVNYDKNALLSQHDADEIVNRINQRRNFVALGLSKHLPQAANMIKLFWSEKLANAAQRWADQCDPSLKPDKEDQCRDLGDTKVGQSIATIVGHSPGLTVKSFIEMWFMQILNYTGSVSYYNQSHHENTKYFTQLIWSGTRTVGCGKAKFFIKEKNVIVDRLVCNFAPAGNMFGKPIYAIGYAATQCPYNMRPDKLLTGLCVQRNPYKVKKNISPKPASSLLRILNLSNNSVKQEIDPIRINMKQIKFHDNKNNYPRNQKTRHVFNNTYGYDNSHWMPRDIGIYAQNFWNNPPNVSKQQRHSYEHEKGHSHVYHGHEFQRNTLGYITNDENTNENYRRYEFTTASSNTIITDYRIYNNRNLQCTRKSLQSTINCQTTCSTYSCTRGRKCASTGCPQTTQCCYPTAQRLSLPIYNAAHIYPHKQCPCSISTTTCAIIPTKCTFNEQCQCLPTICPATSCSNVLKAHDHGKNNPSEFHNYDIRPNIALRSASRDNEQVDAKLFPLSSEQIQFSRSTRNDVMHSSKIINLHEIQKFDPNIEQVKKTIDYPKPIVQDHDFLYGSFDSSERIRRDNEEAITFKPFWQMDEFGYQKPPHLKAMKFTTLPDRKYKKPKKTNISLKLSSGTEPITIKLKDKSNPTSNLRDHITEKYLSFDELLHLRKLSTAESNIDYEPRRKEGGRRADTSTNAPVTTEITTNTPFERKKYCTRKLTCTWTAPTITAADGSAIISGAYIDTGSRTPPGYVDGCTRTSTCTRDYMDRNKMVMPEETTDSNPTQQEDEDYCERRSLNIHRRDCSEKSNKNNIKETKDKYDHFTIQPFDISKFTRTIVEYNVNTEKYCDCSQQNIRIKRDEDKIVRNVENKLSYGDVYYLVLNKILKLWQNNNQQCRKKECLCNSAYPHYNYMTQVIILSKTFTEIICIY